MKNLLTWLKKQNEYIPLAISLLVFIASPYVLHWFDHTAGTYDIGILQIPITSIISYGIFQAMVWLTLKVNWLPIRQYFEELFVNEFQTLTPCAKIIISLSVYFALLFSLVLLSRVI